MIINVYKYFEKKSNVILSIEFIPLCRIDSLDLQLQKNYIIPKNHGIPSKHVTLILSPELYQFELNE